MREGTIAVLECKGEYAITLAWLWDWDRASLIIRWRKLDPYNHDVHGLASIRDSMHDGLWLEWGMACMLVGLDLGSSWIIITQNNT
jgi:hypothetical protein